MNMNLLPNIFFLKYVFAKLFLSWTKEKHLFSIEIVFPTQQNFSNTTFSLPATTYFNFFISALSNFSKSSNRNFVFLAM